MGHYDSCYEAEYEREYEAKLKRVARLTKEYEEEIKKYGIAEFLARKEVFK